MVDAWVEGAERIQSKAGATYREPNSPWRFVFHTMEAPSNATSGLWSTVAGLKSYIATHAAPPHFWCWPEKNWLGQGIPLTLSAYALLHPSGTPETNHKHAIQVEILGYAANKPATTHAEWLGRRIIGPVIKAGVPLNLTHLARSDGPASAGTGGSVRFTAAQWAAFDGLCGHQNVPNNSHWDPGIADYQTIARAAGGTEEDDMIEADHVRIAATIRAENQRQAQYLAMGVSNQAYPADPWATGTTNNELLAATAKVLAAVAQVGIIDVDEAALAAALLPALLTALDPEQVAAILADALGPDIGNIVVAALGAKLAAV